MILFLVRAVWPLVRPLVVVAAIGAVCLIVLGFNPPGMAKEFLVNAFVGSWDWLSCEVVGWC